MQRVVLIVLDGVGCGELPDAKSYGDIGSNTLGNLGKQIAKSGKLHLPNLTRWGLGNITDIPGVPKIPLNECIASFGKCNELSKGKDTTSGHWEMAGVVVKKAFKTYPKGFPKKAIDEWIRKTKIPGVLGNKSASGTEIIKELGEEHIKTGKPILYTSADSVWQVAAHEETFGLRNLYDICKEARSICDDLDIGRVIARPFIGKKASDFKRTHHRKDYSQSPTSKTMMEYLVDRHVPVVGIGKIWNIYNGAGIQESHETADNAEGLKVLKKVLKKTNSGLLFLNLVDFDMLYGHRRDPIGFAKSLEEFDSFLPQLQKELEPEDIVIVSADHGNDPTYKGSDHTREYVPLLVYSKSKKAIDLGTRHSFADIGQSVLHSILGKDKLLKEGKSFYHK
ncbi:MAG: phosphopentomutase [Bacteriovoracia bacterium]